MDSTKPMARTSLTVRYHECDPSGIVFNANYLAYADIASFRTFETVLGPYEGLASRGLELVVAESNLRFLAPCRPKDELEIAGLLDRLGTTSMVLRFQMHRGEELVAEVTNRYVWVDAETKKSITPPAGIREALSAYAPPA
ncbi:acyl-CoA thioesterase [Dietzia sp. NPDC055343]